jgi:hypothetical protein
LDPNERREPRQQGKIMEDASKLDIALPIDANDVMVPKEDPGHSKNV